MRHLTPGCISLGLALLAAPNALGAEAKWTHGRSACEADTRQLFAAIAAVDRAPLVQAWEYALQDVDSLASLSCASDAAATEVGTHLRLLQEQLLPGLRAAGCDAGEAPREQKLVLIREATARMHGSESFFEGTLDRVDELQRKVAQQIPEGGVPFDDCRAKAQRGWARARASINKLSCEFSAALERMEAFRDPTSVAAFECAAPQVASAADTASATAAAVVVPPSPTGGGYVPFTGAEQAREPQK
jgi:hypothetical protein